MNKKQVTTDNRSTNVEKYLQIVGYSGDTIVAQQPSISTSRTHPDRNAIRQRSFVRLGNLPISRVPSRQPVSTTIQRRPTMQPATTTIRQRPSVQPVTRTINRRSPGQSITTSNSRLPSVQPVGITIEERASVRSATTSPRPSVDCDPIDVIRRPAVQNDTPIRPRPIAQSFHLIWLDINIDESNKDSRNSAAQLRSVFSSIDAFNDADQCVNFLANIQDDKVFMIVSGYMGERVVPDIHHLSQLDLIYVLCEDRQTHEQWANKWPKVKGVFTEMGPICDLLKQAALQYNQDSIAISFVSVSNVSNENLDQLDQSFMYTQLIKELLLEIDYDEQSIKDLCNVCRDHYVGNERELTNIDIFEREYRLKTPIYWYTYEGFLYSMLNRSLRTQEMNIIIKMGFFLRDLHRLIEQLYLEQFGHYQQKNIFIVYRGQGLPNDDFIKLQMTKGGLLSFNNFLSTSLSRDIAFGFTKNSVFNSKMTGILFKMIIDPSISTTPFAEVYDTSYYKQEKEVLFSMHTIFRIGEIEQIKNSDRLWQVELTLTSDNDQQLNALAERIREETFRGEKGWYRLGMLLIRAGEFNLAEQLYQVLLEQSFEDKGKASLLHQIAYIKEDQGDYRTALEFYEKSLELKQKTLPSDHPSLGITYGNIGSFYNEMGTYSKALSFYEKTLEIFQKYFPPNDSNLATCYNNIGLVYENMDNCLKALSFYEKALEIDQIVLSSNDPDLATVYNNMGLVYDKMNEYSKALLLYENALNIFQRTLPRNNSSLAIPYSNIGSVYNNMGEHSKALSFYEKALEIDQKTLPTYHASLAMANNNIGSVLKNMTEYSKALPFCERAVDIGKRILPPNHPFFLLYEKNLEFVKQKL